MSIGIRSIRVDALKPFLEDNPYLKDSVMLLKRNNAYLICDKQTLNYLVVDVRENGYTIKCDIKEGKRIEVDELLPWFHL